MAKSAKHKRLRKQEKAKTQLKGGKSGITKLGKSQNVVEPTLKAKKILVREQLLEKSSSEEVYTKHKQSFQDVMNSLNHHNSNTKKEGFRGLEELVTSQSNILELHLDRILEKIAALTYDEEGSIRKENLKVSEIIFARVNENQVKPFWNLMLMHVKCTLTSLNSVIRYSSLSFLQLLVSYFPNLISGSLHIILPNLLGLISSSGSGNALRKNQQAVRLKVEISEKHSDINERLRVLALIATCLDLRKNFSTVSVQRNGRTDNKESRTSCKTGSSVQRFANDYEEEKCIPQKSAHNNYLSLYHPWGYDTLASKGNSTSNNPDTWGDFLSTYNRSIFSSSFSENTELPLDQIWTQFINSCLSVLCETWIEVGPSNDAKKTTSGLKRKQQRNVDVEKTRGNNGDKNSRAAATLSKAAVEVLTCIMNVMKHLVGGGINGFVSVEKRDFNLQTNSDTSKNELRRTLRKSYGRNITKYFLRWLPFSAVQESHYSVIAGLNLQLFYIAAQFRIFDADIMSKFESYLNWIIKKDLLDAEKTSLVLNILSCLHLTNVGSLASKFICHALESRQETIIHNFLNSILRQSSSSGNAIGLVKGLSWDELCLKIIQSMKSLTPEILELLALVSIRKLTDLKTVVDHNISAFLDYCKMEGTAEAWEQTVRVFYYCNSLDMFLSDNINIPQEIRGTAEALLC